MFFAFPFALVILGIIPIWIFAILWGERKYVVYGRPHNSKKSNTKHVFRYLRLVFGSLTIASIALTLAEPRYTTTFQDPIKSGIDIAIVLDISRSMLAEDVTPNRIEWAKNAILSFIDSRSNDRLSLTVFAGKPFILSPLTFDRLWLINIVKNIGTNTIRQEIEWMSGTNIWDAMLLALQNLKNTPPNTSREKIILLLTDGEANVGTDPKFVALQAKEAHISIYSIGIGSEKWTELIITNPSGEKVPLIDEKTWRPILARVDGELLRFLAKTTAWFTANAEDLTALEEAFSEINSQKKSELLAPMSTETISLMPWFALMTVFFAFGFFVSERRIFDSAFFSTW